MILYDFYYSLSTDTPKQVKNGIVFTRIESRCSRWLVLIKLIVRMDLDYYALLCGDKVYDDLDHFGEGVNGNGFIDAMEIHTAGGEVRAGEPFVGEAGAVGAASDGNKGRRKARRFHGILGAGNDGHIFFYDISHVVVAVLDLAIEGAIAVFSV